MQLLPSVRVNAFKYLWFCEPIEIVTISCFILYLGQLHQISDRNVLHVLCDNLRHFWKTMLRDIIFVPSFEAKINYKISKFRVWSGHMFWFGESLFKLRFLLEILKPQFY